MQNSFQLVTEFSINLLVLSKSKNIASCVCVFGTSITNLYCAVCKCVCGGGGSILALAPQRWNFLQLCRQGKMATICQLFTHRQTHTHTDRHTQLNEDRNPASIQVCNTEANLSYKQTHAEMHNGVKSALKPHTHTCAHTHTHTHTHIHTHVPWSVSCTRICPGIFVFVIVRVRVYKSERSFEDCKPLDTLQRA